MTTSPQPAVRLMLGVLVLPVGALGVVSLLLGIGTGRPTWWLLGLVATLHAIVLFRTTVASAHPVDDANRAKAAAWPEPWAGLLAAMGGLWGLLTPPATAEPAPLLPLVLLGVGGAAALIGGRYAADTPGLPEGPALGRWSRFTGWAVGLAAIEHGLTLAGIPQPSLMGWIARATSLFVLILGIEILVGSRRDERSTAPLSGVDPAVLRWGFARWNPLASLGDALQESLGVDLRTTWAIQFLRAAVEPMVVAVVLFGWLCTGLVRVGPEEVGIHERLGRPLSRTPLGPGLHVVEPWPVGQLRRVSTKRVSTMPIGAEEHGEEGEEEEHDGPEDTLWARMHAEEEYTLLLGDGRDLVTLDGLLHYRVSPTRTPTSTGRRIPEEGLRAAAYEALTRRTVGRSLDAVLSPKTCPCLPTRWSSDIGKRASRA